MARISMTRQRSSFYLKLIHIFCFLAICCLYGSLITYYCMAAPVDLNKITSPEPQVTQEININASQSDLGQNVSKDICKQEGNALSFLKETPRVMAKEDSLGSEFYLNQITSFYQNMITWMFAIIGAILAINYLYIRLSSRMQAEEMAAQALENAGFLAQLDKKLEIEVGKKWANTDIITIGSDIEELKERVQFLEDSVTEESYGPIEEKEPVDPQKEGQDGNNTK